MELNNDLAKLSASLPWAKSMVTSLDLERRNTLRENSRGLTNRLMDF